MKKSGKDTGKRSGKPPTRPPAKSFGKSGRPGARPARGDSAKDARTETRNTDKRGAKSQTKPQAKSQAKSYTKAQTGSAAKPAPKSATWSSQKPPSKAQGKFVATARERDDIAARDQRPRGKRAGVAYDRAQDLGAPRMGRSSVKRRDSGAATPREKTVRAPSRNLGPRPNLFGLHAVREAWLNPKRSIHALYLTEETERVFATWPSPPVARPLPIPATKEELERMLGRDCVHQGFALSVAPIEEVFAQDIIAIGTGKDRSVVLMLDQVTDPHNVGAILRSACAFGADGVIMQRRHAPELEGVLCKTACGAVEHLAVAYETNLSRTLEELSEAGYTIIGLDEHAEHAIGQIDLPERAVLVLGAEGEGMRRLIKEHCNVLVTLPTHQPIASLNVSNAAAVALYALIK